MPGSRAARWMRTPVIILAPATGLARDPLNRPSLAFQPVAGDWKCQKQQTAAKEVATEEGNTVVADWLFFLPIDAPVTPACRLRVAGQDYKVESVDDAGGVGDHLEVLARRVAPPKG